MTIAELYTSTTARIVSELEQGVCPWVKPWQTIKGAASVPMNVVTGRQYSGANTLLLAMEAMDKGYPSHGWLTFNQAKDLKANVRRGERGTPVIFTKWTETEKNGETVKRSLVKLYSLFSTAQVDGLPEQYTTKTEPEPIEVVRKNALRLLVGCGAQVIHGGSKAAYYPKQDQIVMPHLKSFTDEDAYWGTAFHETVHSSGHESRLNRQFGKRYADEAYQREELCAELGSAFQCARLGIPPIFRSASYIDGWLKIMKADKHAVFGAASHASQAADYLWNAVFPAEKQEAA